LRFRYGTVSDVFRELREQLSHHQLSLSVSGDRTPCRAADSEKAQTESLAPCRAALASPRTESFAFSIMVASFMRMIFLFVVHGILIRYPITEFRCNKRAAFLVLALPTHHAELFVQKLSDQMVQKALTLLMNSKTFRQFSLVYYSPS